ncbi:MAG TPA: uroporphyrinogen decarboxylase [Spirochaetia bacterium]|nr:uroporphyrinogen decarboxylase [Spirochaetia bacterium]
MGEPAAASSRREGLASSAFLKACRLQKTEVTPLWLMRQAGRYLPEYRALRESHSMQDLIRSPELAARVTLQPLARFDLDAAIIFCDILPPLAGMGLSVSFESDRGPGIENPLRSTRDIDMLAVPPAEETLGSTLEAIRIAGGELSQKGIPLIGFAAAPFTLASYAVEGGGSKSYTKTKYLMYSEPAAWERLMRKLTTVLADFLRAQVEAGASAVQVFDSWAGIALGKEDYVRYVLPHTTRLFSAVKAAGVPAINFSTGTGAFIEAVASAGGDVVGVDWRLPLHDYWERIDFDRPIQGNLDPAALVAPWRELQPRIDAILDQAAGRPGHIFNLGHGVLPETSPDTVKRLVDYVHERRLS